MRGLDLTQHFLHELIELAVAGEVFGLEPIFRLQLFPVGGDERGIIKLPFDRGADFLERLLA
jgi:hypothetical protein